MSRALKGSEPGSRKVALPSGSSTRRISARTTSGDSTTINAMEHATATKRDVSKGSNSASPRTRGEWPCCDARANSASDRSIPMNRPADSVASIGPLPQARSRTGPSPGSAPATHWYGELASESRALARTASVIPGRWEWKASMYSLHATFSRGSLVTRRRACHARVGRGGRRRGQRDAGSPSA